MNKTNHRRARQGIALMLVLVVIALASVLGYAMLSGATVRSQIGHNAEVTSEAEALAESGVNLALYYLQYPEFAPGGPFTATGPYWTGTGGPIGFASSVDGTIDVTVARDASNKWTYDIVSTGRTTSDATIARIARTRVSLVTKYEVKHAAVFNNDLTVPLLTVFDGSIFSQRGAVLKSVLNVTGVGYRRLTPLSLFAPQGGWQPFPFKPLVIPPALSDIRSYRTYAYVNDGSTDTAGSLAAGSTRNTDLNPSSSNRAGVYYAEGDLTIGGDMAVKGTLIVRGNLVINTNSATFEPKPGFPALVVEGNIDIRKLAPNIEVRGLCWVRDRIFATATSLAVFKVEGGLMIGGTSPFFNGSTLAKPNVKYVAANADIPDLCEVGRTITAINVLKWSTAQ